MAKIFKKSWLKTILISLPVLVVLAVVVLFSARFYLSESQKTSSPRIASSPPEDKPVGNIPPIDTTSEDKPKVLGYLDQDGNYHAGPPPSPSNPSSSSSYNGAEEQKERQKAQEAAAEKQRQRRRAEQEARRETSARREAEAEAKQRTTDLEYTPPPTEEIKRFPTIESPNEVKVGESIAIMISLTEDLLTPTVKVTQGKTDSEGRLKLSLPKQEDNQDWEIDVVLSASGFTFDSANKATLSLPKNGDSSPAMFLLTAKESGVVASQRNLYATFWHKGQYLARAMKPIIVNQNEQNLNTMAAQNNQVMCAANDQLSAESKKVLIKGETVNLNSDRYPPDLTIYMRRDWDSCSKNDYFITLSSPHMETTHQRITMPENINDWLMPKYQQFSSKGRGIKIVKEEATTATPSSSVEATKDNMLGFGRLLYKKFAPSSFTVAYQTLKTKLANNFDTIQIFTDDPSIPWELMVPDNSETFIGIEQTVGRWIIPKTASEFTIPPQNMTIDNIFVMAPEYQGDLKLTATIEEASFIKNLLAQKETKSVNGTYAALKQNINTKGSSFLHFAGHGYTTREGNQNITDYGILLEDEKLSSLNWRGMLGSKTNTSFVFFNACDVGQAEKAAGFVDGWSTTLTDTGSSGFISGLWELGDEGAFVFSKAFYNEIASQLKYSEQISVGIALQKARREFLENGNPTFLAYVYYGDPLLGMNIK